VNAHTIKYSSLAAAVLMLGFSFSPLGLEKAPGGGFLCPGAALAELLVFLFASIRCARKKYAKAGVYTAFFIYFAGLMAFGICLGLTRPGETGAAFCILLTGAQIVFFAMHPLGNLLLNMAAALIFSALAISQKPPEIWRYAVVNAAAAGLIGTVLAWYVSRLILNEMIAAWKLEEERNRFQEESRRDALTGLSNRRDYLHTAPFFVSVCQHVRQTICAIMMDVDYFKKYNDFYGHQRGDGVLQAIGKALRVLIEEDRVFAARVGGEEFIILWTENRIAEAERVAIKLRHLIADLRIPHEQSGAAPYVTVSMGLYVLRGGASGTVDGLYNKADEALYAAKRQGRNCIILLDSADGRMRRVETLPPEQNVGRNREER
jgi:diguanylate cyclase (GGDEF)-like protein